MLVINGRNVSEIWRRALPLLKEHGVMEQSRAGAVLVAPCPVTSVYQQPRERVLLDPARDANPFFHLFESLWMLAGRDDAAFLNRFVRDFGERFAESDGMVHDAYGHRWRRAMGYDQLDVVVDKLRENPGDRQCVIQMWDAKNCQEGFEDAEDLRGDWRGRPCNTHVYLRVRNERVEHRARRGDLDRAMFWPVLDLTVCCRSNDIVWGAYGANAVHFSILQEYLAGRVGASVGKMYQLSNNWHGYVSVLQKYEEADRTADADARVLAIDPYSEDRDEPVRWAPIGTDWGEWDKDLAVFLAWAESNVRVDVGYVNRWFYDTARPMWLAHERHREKNREEALRYARMVAATDWRAAATQWIERRSK